MKPPAYFEAKGVYGYAGNGRVTLIVGSYMGPAAPLPELKAALAWLTEVVSWMEDEQEEQR
jgi:hypothetical protein